MADKGDDQGFLQRWSARKLDARQQPDAIVDEAAADDATDAVVQTVDEEAAPPPDLPDIDTLDAHSDYTAFLGKNVPQDLAKLALRKLWRSDPTLACLDGLNDYDEDFTKVDMASEAVKTLYKVGKGFLTAEDETPREAMADADDTGTGEATQEPKPEPESEAAPSSEAESDAEAFHDAELIERD